jgi:uncharacterized membrane protein
MDGEPESTTSRRRWAGPIGLAVVAVFVLYLLFRLGQGVVWLVHTL